MEEKKSLVLRHGFTTGVTCGRVTHRELQRGVFRQTDVKAALEAGQQREHLLRPPLPRAAYCTFADIKHGEFPCGLGLP